jgi:hypothetical protein
MEKSLFETNFPLEILNKILLNCCIKSILTFSSCSKFCQIVAKNQSLWRVLSLERFKVQKLVQFTKDSYQLYKELHERSLFPTDELQLSKPSESTFDHVTQRAENCLDDDSQSFYSSLGTTHDTLDFLQFDFLDFTMIQKVVIKPFLAQFQKGTPTYAPKRISFTFWSNGNEETTEEFEIENVPLSVTIDLNPAIITKRLIINLIEKVQTQPIDSLYYTCIERVQVFGASRFSTENYSNIQQALLSYSNQFLISKETERQSLNVDHQKTLSSWTKSSITRKSILKDCLYHSFKLHHHLTKCRVELRNKLFYTQLKKVLGNVLFAKHFTELMQYYCTELVPFTRDEVIILLLLSFTDFEGEDQFINPLKDLSCHSKDLIKYSTDHSFAIRVIDEYSEIIDQPKRSGDALPIKLRYYELLVTSIQCGLVEFTLEFGLILEIHGRRDIAFHLYQKGRIIDKLIECYLLLDYYSYCVEILLSFYNAIEIYDFIEMLHGSDSKKCFGICKNLIAHGIEMNFVDRERMDSLIRRLFDIPRETLIADYFEMNLPGTI